ncbi:MAG: hypothetical protein KIT31_02820 [Deltaproteobacteria bacterium]|nr:hypothetical protein [Deltaproteobacteria bacterium]
MPVEALLLFALAGGAIAGAALLLAGARKRPPPEAPPASAPRLADGEVVTVTGTVRAIGAPLVSPLAARSCVLYEAYANIYETNDGPHRALAAQIFDRRMAPFELETSLGTIVVDDVEAELELLPRPVFPRRIEREVAFLRQHGREPALAHTTGFEETTIDPGALVAVHGLVRVEASDGDARIRLTRLGDEAPMTIGPPKRTVLA